MASEIAPADRILAVFPDVQCYRFSAVSWNGVVLVRKGSQEDSQRVDLDEITDLFIKKIQEISGNLSESERGSAIDVISCLIGRYQAAREQNEIDLDKDFLPNVLRWIPGFRLASSAKIPQLEAIRNQLGVKAKKTA